MALLFSAAACTSKKTTEVASSSENVQIPNPWVDCDTIEDAEKLAGFAFELPEAPDGYTLDHISAVKDDIIQVIYKNGEEELCFRKAAGVDDASGDYNKYDTTATAAVSGCDVTLKANGEEYHLAVWKSGEDAYSISSSEAQTEETMRALAESVVQANS